MTGPKFMVFQMKHIIKLGLCVVAALILIFLLLWAFTPRNQGITWLYEPGTYAAQIILNSRPVDVLVTVSRNEILSVELRNMSETQEVFYPLFQPTMNELSRQIIRYQSTRIATQPENAVTSRILLDAVNLALEQAMISN